MPSGKRARQQRAEAAAALRPPPAVRSKGVGGVRARRASPRALAIGGAVLALLAIAGVLAAVLSSGGGGGSGVVKTSDVAGLPSVGSQTWPGAMVGAGPANDLFKGIPQHGLTLGKPSAPVTMEMFIDVQCPFCQQYETSTLPTIVTKYVRQGKVQLHLKPWAFIGSQSFSGRLGVIAASNQNKGFQYAKVLYDNQPANAENTGYLDGKWMANIAASVTGLKMAQWRADVNSSGSKKIADQVSALAGTEKVNGTPTVFVGRTGGKLNFAGAPGNVPSLQQTEQAINAALANG